MESKLVALVMIALLVGLGGGYGLGHLLYQPQIQDFTNQVQGLQNDINDLEDDIDGMDVELDTVNSTLRDTQSSVTSLRDDVNVLDSDVTSLNSTVETMGNEVNIIDSDVANLNSTVETVENEVNTIDSDVASLNSTVETIENNVNVLNSEVGDLNSTVETMENRTWHLVYSIQASSDLVSGLFQLKGSSVRISWDGLSTFTDGWLYIGLYFANGIEYGYWGSSGVWAAMDCEVDLVQAGDYYLEIYTYLTDYGISVWDYY